MMWTTVVAVGVVLASLSSVSGQQAKGAGVRIVLAGDSTVTDDAGWGTGFKRLAGTGVEVINTAKGGRSSKSFRDEGHWDKAIAAKGDYVLIQFGHNDQPGKGPERETDPGTTFRDNLRRYVEEVRAAGGKPVLVTSLVRRNFKERQLRSNLVEYADATAAVARETGTPLIDLHARSLAYCNSIGEAGCREISPLENEKIDTTHLNQAGSVAIGRLVVEDLVKLFPELAEHFELSAEPKNGR